MRITDRIGIALAAAAALSLAGTAHALPQFVPTPTAKAHTLLSGESGFTWNTTADPADQIQYDDGSRLLSVQGEIDVANFYDPLYVGPIPYGPACPTDSGSNCTFNYSPNLDLTVLAEYLGATATPLGGGMYDIVLDFQTAGGTDILWTDPADGNSVMLSASWTAGTFNAAPTPGLQVIAQYCDGVGGCGAAGVIDDPVAIGFALIDNSSLYAGLFDSDANPFNDNSIMVDFSELFDFVTPVGDGSINAIAAFVLADPENDLPDFTGEGQGQLYRVDTGEFVIPEPSTAMLFGLGIAGLGALRRRGDR